MMLSWIERQKLLLTAELAAEAEQLTEKIKSIPAKRCEQQGLSLLHLSLVNVKNSLFGRFSITLESNRVKNKILDRVCFKPGDEVVLYSERNLSNKSKSVSSGSSSLDNLSSFSINGVVSRVNNENIDIVTDQSPEEVDLAPPLRLDLRSNEYTHRKMMEVLKDLEHSNNSHPLIPLLFDELHLSPSSLRSANNYTKKTESITFISSSSVSANISTQRDVPFKLNNPSLNVSQINAIKGSLEATYISLIHGPPGTGKTSTVTELIFQCVSRNMRVLVCAPSNVAVDNILEKIVNGLQSESMISAANNDNNLPRCLRLGHPARVSEAILKYCLDSQIIEDDGTDIVSDIKKEINDLRKSLSKQQQKKKGSYHRITSSFKETRKEISSLQKDLKKREIKIVKSIIQSKNVILCTTIGAGNKLIKDIMFDVVIIDECAQGLEAACWIPILRGKKCVLAGDHFQLPPTIKSMPSSSSSSVLVTNGSNSSDESGLSLTLFERIMNINKKSNSNKNMFDQVIFLLNTQYRMNDKICSWASRQVYDNLLLSHESVSQHTLKDFQLILSSITTRFSSHSSTSSSSSYQPSLHASPLSHSESNKSSMDISSTTETTTEMVREGSCLISECDAFTQPITFPYLSLPVLLLVDTAGSAPEGVKQTEDAISHSNRIEAYLVLRHVKMLIASGMKACDIGVITPYNNQVQLLKKLFFSTSLHNDDDDDDDDDTAALNPYSNNHFNKETTSSQELQSHSSLSDTDWQRLFTGLEIRTVDGFQGGEKECIVLSLVRSNTPHREVGFLRDKRRINVAVTRAKRHLAVICDVYTCSNDVFIDTLLNHIKVHGEHRYAEEYLHMSDVELWSDYDDKLNEDHTERELQIGNEANNNNNNNNNNRIKKLVTDHSTTNKVQHDKQLKVDDIECVIRNLSLGIYSPNTIHNTRLQYFWYDYTNNDYISVSHENLILQQQQAPSTSEKQVVIRFPTSLNSHDRMIAHDLCEQCSLYHRSRDSSHSSSSHVQSNMKPPLRFVEVSAKPFNEKANLVATADIAAATPPLLDQPIIPETHLTDAVSCSSVAVTIDTPDTVTDGAVSSGSLPTVKCLANTIPSNDSDSDAEGSDSDNSEFDNVCNGEHAIIKCVSQVTTSNDDGVNSPTTCNNNNNNNNSNHNINKSKQKQKKAASKVPPSIPVATSSQQISTTNNSIRKPTNTAASTSSKPLQYYVSEERRKARQDAEKVVNSVNPLAFDDEDAALEAAINANQVYSTMTQYRVGCSAPMPNPVKIQTQKALKSMIDEAQKSRQSKVVKQQQLEQQQVQQQQTRNGYSVISPSSSCSHSKGGNKKVDKKPTSEEMRRIRLAQIAAATSSTSDKK